MTDILLTRAPKVTIPLILLTEQSFKSWQSQQEKPVVTWCKTQDFTGQPGRILSMPDPTGKLQCVVMGVGQEPSLWDLGDAAMRLPKAVYRLTEAMSPLRVETLALGWSLGAYRYDRYKSKKNEGEFAQLVLPKDVDVPAIERMVNAVYFARDLINTPAEDMGPAELAGVATAMAKGYGAECHVIVGDDLLKKNYPAIHRVGRASTRAPRLIDLRWGKKKAPKVVIVGKGVCFDTGGLDLKPSSAMYLMKKDMAGAAIALGLATAIIDANLPIHVRVLIPAVDNAIAGNAFRPSDVITMRNGMTVEVGNTDAEGRLVMADCLADAMDDNPDVVIDISTLTGAARTAVGTEISALFCNDESLSLSLTKNGRIHEDHIWPLPLFSSYRRQLDSPIADMNSCPSSPYAGAITAALFLEKFIKTPVSWAHFDLMGWNLSSRPGRPEGGEATALRAIFHMLVEKFRSQEKA